ncbi:MAG: hypothetical protein ACI8PZ_004536 [Myxococcota bacterium]|jgi:hypothetical protein
MRMLVCTVLLVGGVANAKKPKKGARAPAPVAEAPAEPEEAVDIPCASHGQVVRYSVHSTKIDPRTPAPQVMESTGAVHVTGAGDDTVDLRIVTESASMTGLGEGPVETLLLAMMERVDEFPPAEARVTFGELSNDIQITNIEVQRAAIEPMLTELRASMEANAEPEMVEMMQGMWPTLMEGMMSDAAIAQESLEFIAPMMAYRCGTYPLRAVTSDIIVPNPFGQASVIPGKMTTTLAMAGNDLSVTSVETLADVDLWAIMAPVLEAAGIERSALPPDLPPLQVDTTTVITIDLADGWPRTWTRDKVAGVLGQVSHESRVLTRLP